MLLLLSLMTKEVERCAFKSPSNAYNHFLPITFLIKLPYIYIPLLAFRFAKTLIYFLLTSIGGWGAAPKS